MRIIAGKLKGRRLAPVHGTSIRPTADRVRESLFGILREAVPGCRFLDLCAGTGSVGIEAYSRGAKEVVFVEPKTWGTLRENLRRCQITQGVRVLPVVAHRALSQLAAWGETFDIIFMDPPYDTPILERSLRFCAQTSLLASDGCIVAEHRRQTPLPDRFGSLLCIRREVYGDTNLSFFIWDEDEEGDA